MGLAAAEEQSDVYRDRCQQLSARVSELRESLESARTALVLRDADHNQETAMLTSELEQLRTLVHALQFATDERLALRASLRTLAARIRRTGGYASPEDQDELRAAERLVAGTTS